MRLDRHDAINNLESLKEAFKSLSISTDRKVHFDLTYREDKRFTHQLYNVIQHKLKDDMEFFWMELYRILPISEYFEKNFLNLLAEEMEDFDTLPAKISGPSSRRFLIRVNKN